MDLIRAAGVSDRFIGRTDQARTGVASVVLDDAGVPAFANVEVAAHSVRIVDTVGAGDAFSA